MGEEVKEKGGRNHGGPVGITRSLAFTPSEMDLCPSAVALLAVRFWEISSPRQASGFCL